MIEELESLFLICPDCFLEGEIKKQFGSYCYFLTALGAVFTLQAFEYAEEINNFIIRENIKRNYVVNDTSCIQIREALNEYPSWKSDSERVLRMLKLKHRSAFKTLPDLIECKKKLAELNIKEQASQLLEFPFVGLKISNNQIGLSGLIYDRKTRKFSHVPISYY